MQADQELVSLIRSRIKHLVVSPKQTASGCEIITFPSVAGESMAVCQEVCFWKHANFWQDLLQFLGVLSFSLSFILTFFVVTTRI
jgi:hypothetical protein